MNALIAELARVDSNHSDELFEIELHSVFSLQQGWVVKRGFF